MDRRYILQTFFIVVVIFFPKLNRNTDNFELFIVVFLSSRRGCVSTDNLRHMYSFFS